jgi:dephospho-CoA kinase
MPGDPAILRVGLTGGIASGKTTVCRILTELGATVIDADEIARDVVQRGGSAHARVVELFGAEILDDEGQIVRPRLAARVFGDARARRALEQIVHPEVLAEFERRVAAAADAGRRSVVVLDAALLVESGAHGRFDRLVVVRCGRPTQLRRLLARGGLSLEEAEMRMEAQAPLESKLRLADYVVDTEGTLRQTRTQTEALYAALVRDLEAQRRGG